MGFWKGLVTLKVTLEAIKELFIYTIQWFME